MPERPAAWIDPIFSLSLAGGLLALLLVPRGQGPLFFIVMAIGVVFCGRTLILLDLSGVQATLTALVLVSVIHGLAFLASGGGYPLGSYYLGGAFRDTTLSLVVEWVLSVQVGIRTRSIESPPRWVAWGALVLVVGASVLGSVLV